MAGKCLWEPELEDENYSSGSDLISALLPRLIRRFVSAILTITAESAASLETAARWSACWWAAGGV